MAIVVLVLWLFTAGAGFYLLVTSNLGRARPAATTRPPPRRPSRPPSPPGQLQPPPRCRLPRSARCDGRRGTGSIRPR